MATVADLLNQSFRGCGMLAAGETPSAEEAQDGLQVLNELIDSWNIENLLVYTIDRLIFPVTAGTQTYTIGVGGVWNTTRPVRIEAASWQDVTQNPVLELPFRILKDQEYEAIRVRTVTSTYPRWLYYDQSYPLGTVFLWPSPMVNNNVVLWLWHPWSSTYTLATVVSFPPGHQRMLVYNLMVELTAQGFGKPLKPEVLALAIDSKARVKILNAETPLMRSDPAIVGTSRRHAGFNWVTGDTV